MSVLTKAPAVYVLTAVFALQVVLATGSCALGLSFLTYQPPCWRTLLIYGCGAAVVGYLCWRQSPRARFAAYVFLTADIFRAVRGSHGATALIDLAVLSVMQLPALRAAYPPIRPGHLRGIRGIRHATPVNGHQSPRSGGRPTSGPGATRPS